MNLPAAVAHRTTADRERMVALVIGALAILFAAVTTTAACVIGSLALLGIAALCIGFALPLLEHDIAAVRRARQRRR